jgi:hypothetical protein
MSRMSANAGIRGREPSSTGRIKLDTMTGARVNLARPASTFRQCSGEFMKVSNSLIAAAVVTLLPLAAFAGDKDKTSAPMTKAQFDTLDANRDGRLSPAEAATDTKIVFSTADMNGDGFLDASEFTQRDKMDHSTTSPSNPDRDEPKPQQ